MIYRKMLLYNPCLKETLEVTWEEEGGKYGKGLVKKYGLHTVGTRDYTFGYLTDDGKMITESGYLLTIINNIDNYPTYKGSQSLPKEEVKREKRGSSFWDSPFITGGEGVS